MLIKTQIINLQRDLTVAQEKLTDQNTRLTSAEVYVADGREFIQTISR